MTVTSTSTSTATFPFFPSLFVSLPPHTFFSSLRFVLPVFSLVDKTSTHPHSFVQANSLAMSFISLAILILAAGSLPVFGAPIAPSTLSNFRIGTTNTRDLHFATTLKKRASDVYVTYSGAGTSFPDESEWVSTFDEMFTANNGILAGGCTQFGVAANSAQEISDIGSGIQQVAGQTGLDSRFILAILLQESNGCTRAPTTNYGVRNPGLMQSHNVSSIQSANVPKQTRTTKSQRCPQQLIRFTTLGREYLQRCWHCAEPVPCKHHHGNDQRWSCGHFFR